MSNRGPLFETFGEFLNRRCREVEQSPEAEQMNKMRFADFRNMILNEFYDCACDPVPSSAARDDRGGSAPH